MSVELIYEGWRRVQDRLIARLPHMTSEVLALKATEDSWPIWAMIGHVAGARAYWLCTVCGEPGLETTPFPDPANEGWEDRLDQPRGSSELLGAVESTWAVVDRCLERWSPDELQVAFTRVRNGETQRHTRYSVLTRLVMHDAFHIGEVSLLLGEHGHRSLDPWEPVQPTD